MMQKITMSADAKRVIKEYEFENIITITRSNIIYYSITTKSVVYLLIVVLQ